MRRFRISINPRLVRGLDYYNLTVFEWVTDRLGAQGTVCAGGRYDGLVEQLGGKPAPACGFAMGLERLLALMQEGPCDAKPRPTRCLPRASGRAPSGRFVGVAECVRSAFAIHAALRRRQLQVANEKGRCQRRGLAVIVGDDETAANAVSVKPAALGARPARNAGSREFRRSGRSSRRYSLPWKTKMATYDLEEQEQLDELKTWWTMYGNPGDRNTAGRCAGRGGMAGLELVAATARRSRPRRCIPQPADPRRCSGRQACANSPAN